MRCEMSVWTVHCMCKWLLILNSAWNINNWFNFEFPEAKLHFNFTVIFVTMIDDIVNNWQKIFLSTILSFNSYFFFLRKRTFILLLNYLIYFIIISFIIICLWTECILILHYCCIFLMKGIYKCAGFRFKRNNIYLQKGSMFDLRPIYIQHCFLPTKTILRSNLYR